MPCRDTHTHMRCPATAPLRVREKLTSHMKIRRVTSVQRKATNARVTPICAEATECGSQYHTHWTKGRCLSYEGGPAPRADTAANRLPSAGFGDMSRSISITRWCVAVPFTNSASAGRSTSLALHPLYRRVLHAKHFINRSQSPDHSKACFPRRSRWAHRPPSLRDEKMLRTPRLPQPLLGWKMCVNSKGIASSHALVFKLKDTNIRPHMCCKTMLLITC